MRHAFMTAVQIFGLCRIDSFSAVLAEPSAAVQIFGLCRIDSFSAVLAEPSAAVQIFGLCRIDSFSRVLAAKGGSGRSSLTACEFFQDLHQKILIIERSRNNKKRYDRPFQACFKSSASLAAK